MLPAFPALALLVGRQLTDRGERRLLAAGTLLGVLVISLPNLALPGP